MWSAERAGSFAPVIDDNHPQNKPTPMKKCLLLLFVVLSFTACKPKKDEVKPKSPASEVAGTYRMTSFRYQTKDKDDELIIPTLPVVQQGKITYSGEVELTEVSDPNQVNLVVRLDFDGQSESVDFENVEVKKSGSKYTLLSDGDQVATVSGSTLSFDVESSDARLAFTAKR